MKIAFPVPLNGARILIFALPFIAVVTLAASSGGYFATTWNWAMLTFAWTVAMVLILGRPERWTRIEIAAVCALLAFACWVGLSALWTIDVTQTVLELQRTLMIVAAVLVLLVVVRRGEHALVLGGVLAAIVAISTYSLATRLFPERLGYFDATAQYRLSTPLGYWNALGVFAVLGILLALAVLLESESVRAQCASAAAVVVLTVTVYYTYGRGPWLALIIGLGALLAFSRRRMRLLSVLLSLGPVVALALWTATRSDALTRRGASLARASHDGHLLSISLLCLAALAAAVAYGRHWFAAHLPPPRKVQLTIATLVIGVALGLVLAGVVYAGGPVRVVQRAYDSFRGPPIDVSNGGSLTSRLWSASSNGRLDYWSVSWREFKASPVGGGGAGSFTYYWPEHRPYNGQVMDAHGLYAETLGELGLVGLVLLVLALALPLVRLRALRKLPLGAGAIAVWLAFLVHAGVDWDWEMSVLPVTALIVILAPQSALRTPESAPGRGLQWAALALAAGLAVAALFFLPGNLDIARAQSANDRQHFAAAAKDAKSAQRWAPWSSQPAYQRAFALDALGRRGEAVASARKGLSHSPNVWQLWALIVKDGKGRERQQAVVRLTVLNHFAPELVALKKPAQKTVAKKAGRK
jgi:hypothetical protein